MPITNLYLTDFGPFDELEFEFDRQVNVFTGPNNSGKSAVLLMLGELLVYPFTAPDKLYRSDSPKWKLRYSAGTKVKSVGGDLPCVPESLVAIYEIIGSTCLGVGLTLSCRHAARLQGNATTLSGTITT